MERVVKVDGDSVQSNDETQGVIGANGEVHDLAGAVTTERSPEEEERFQQAALKMESMMRRVRVLSAVLLLAFIVWEVVRVMTLLSDPHRPLSAAQARYAVAQCRRDGGSFKGGYIDHEPSLSAPFHTQPRIVLRCSMGPWTDVTQVVWLKSEADVPEPTKP